MTQIGDAMGNVGIILIALTAMGIILSIFLAIDAKGDQRKETNVGLMVFVTLCAGAGAFAPVFHLVDTARVTARAFTEMAASGVFNIGWRDTIAELLVTHR
ncbi:hypothetical protein GCM10025867_50880 (plasmid) [Frondihabitans sucicola]|uniref:Uncharacterized protein n=1 Tax=Frondihabitans sucicola TaxID=1268041 RepID=A0ABM8GWK4_9MICO|nr:hypothetical protein [Frondihabitans sucicola]BDZ52847.1 hypothetical protein GCM10025867_50880 [Frondihabitans sucicola]